MIDALGLGGLPPVGALLVLDGCPLRVRLVTCRMHCDPLLVAAVPQLSLVGFDCQVGPSGQ